MRCDLGRLRAYIDNDLPPAESSSVQLHLATCAKCREDVTALREQKDQVAARLACLEPPPAEIPDPVKSLARFRATARQPQPGPWNIVGRDIKMTARSLFVGRWRPVTIGLAALLFVAVLFSFAPVRQAAADFLSIFRVRKFAVIPIDPDQAARLESLARSLESGGLSEPATVREPGAPQAVADAAEASAVAGFPVRVPVALPEGSALSEFSTVSGPALHFEVDRPTMQALLSAAGVEEATLPTVETMVGDVDVPVMVTQEYTIGGSGRISIVQVPSPEVSLSPEVDPTLLGQLGLQVLGLPPADARRVAEEIDWTSTLIIPLPTDVARSREITVDGTTGLLLEASSQGRPLRQESVLIWERDGVLYGVSGLNVAPSILIQVGDSLR